MANRFLIAIKSIHELGFTPIMWLLLYRTGLYSGLWRLLTPSRSAYPDHLSRHEHRQDIQENFCTFPFTVPSKEALIKCLGRHAETVVIEANEIVDGKLRYFGATAEPFDTSTDYGKHHWSEYETHRASYRVDDVKWLWEPGRFGWAYTLSRAYIITEDDIYPRTFWKYTSDFLKANPPNRGPYWTSAQEVALRLLALLFANNVFHSSPSWTSECQKCITNAVIVHASRIPPTISYARAQNNNHLLTEALGLFAAGVSLPNWHKARQWKTTGWSLINIAVSDQVEESGCYIQHSTNYHRLMLQVVLWAQAIAKHQQISFPPVNIRRINRAVYWLLSQMDPQSGKVPNLGHNDGAYIFPLSASCQSDFRPVAQAASKFFLNSCVLPPGYWDELSLWLGLDAEDNYEQIPPLPQNPDVHVLGDEQSWGSIRAVKFKKRPAHADQLHVDLWWKGMNIALDAGTYSYNKPSPWNNSLKHTRVHNTVSIDQKDQMLPAGRFLWLDWAQADIIHSNGSDDSVTAEHDGYRSLKAIHRRTLQRQNPDQWTVTDHILPSGKSKSVLHSYVHWLLPDFPWTIQDSNLELSSPGGTIRISVAPLAVQDHHLPTINSIQIIRAGETLHGSIPSKPEMGWFSPTYFVKQPALSFCVGFYAEPPYSMITVWRLG